MPHCQPICGYIYNKEKVDFSKVLAPPYDVVTPREVRTYKNLSLYNSFHLELAEDSRRAKELLQEWKKNNILCKTSQPSVFFYQIKFSFRGKELERKGFILLVRLHQFSEGIILPHERTFSSVKEERFKLLSTTQCYFSQVFGLFEDPEQKAFFTLEKALSEENLIFSVKINQERHILYQITSRDVIKALQEHLQDKIIYIADGHHRYQTALAYQTYLEKKLNPQGPCDFHYLPFYLSSFEDKGLLMLPTHRFYQIPFSKELVQRFSQFAEIVKPCRLEEVDQILETYGEDPTIFLLFHQGQGLICRINLQNLEVGDIKDNPLSELPLYNFLLLFHKIFGFNEEALKEKGKVEFFSEEQKEIFLPRKEGFCILFPRVKPKVLKEVVKAGYLMPHKSTYFYPKILTGAVFYEVTGKAINPESTSCL